MALQLEFFSEEKSYLEYLREDIKDVRESNNKVRRSLFAKHDELAKSYIDLHKRLEMLERILFKGVA